MTLLSSLSLVGHGFLDSWSVPIDAVSIVRPRSCLVDSHQSIQPLLIIWPIAHERLILFFEEVLTQLRSQISTVAEGLVQGEEARPAGPVHLPQPKSRMPDRRMSPYHQPEKAAGRWAARPNVHQSLR